MGLLETAAATLLGGERRTEIAARNVTNANTPGYKREIAYSEVTEVARQGTASKAGPLAQMPKTSSTIHSNQGALLETGNPLDLAVNGTAYLLVRDGEQFALTRGGNFSVGSGGALVDPLGRIVQGADGGDIDIVNVGSLEILPDGTVLDDEVPIGAIGLFEPGEMAPSDVLTQTQLRALEIAGTSELKQGMIERSNVTLSDEMVELMRNQRQVESGAQLVRAYDQLMSQAISTFSRSGS